MEMNSQPVRVEIAARFLAGSGIEIGALQKPLPLPPGAKVEYVDRLTLEAARREFRELDGIPLVTPTIITDADTLSGIPDATYDFCVSCNVIEHVRDPIGAIRHWLRVLKPGGVLFLEAPDHDNFMDRLRPVTTLEHLIADHECRASRTDLDRRHFYECVHSTHHAQPESYRDEIVRMYIATDYAVHFHVFDEASFRAMIDAVGRYAAFRVAEFHVIKDPDMLEFLAILVKS